MNSSVKYILTITLFLLSVIPIFAQQEKKQAMPPPTQVFREESFGKSGEPFTLKRMTKTVDIHSHIIPTEYMDILKKHHAELVETFPLPSWNVKSHLGFMDKAGIETSVLTLPVPQPYFGDAEESRLIIREINEYTAHKS